MPGFLFTLRLINGILAKELHGGQMSSHIELLFRSSVWGLIMPVGSSILSYIPRSYIPLIAKILLATALLIISVIMASWRTKDGTNSAIFLPLWTVMVAGGFICLFAYGPPYHEAVLSVFDAMLLIGIIVLSSLLLKARYRAFLFESNISGNLIKCTT